MTINHNFFFFQQKKTSCLGLFTYLQQLFYTSYWEEKVRGILFMNYKRKTKLKGWHALMQKTPAE